MIGVVGGLGFIGTYLCRRLREEGSAARVLDKRSAPSSTHEGLPAVRADVRNVDELATGLRGCDVIVNLAAEHRDDVMPRRLYTEVNVGGARNICAAARSNGIEKIIFTSSVAVYGVPPAETDESGRCTPVSDYGRTKLLAENVYRSWLSEAPSRRSLTIIRPTVVFGERNRGNVYNLCRQVADGRFLMVGDGTNRKSMAYVENVAAFLAFSQRFGAGEHLFNYVDKPDMDMRSLVGLIQRVLGRDSARLTHVPYWLGYLGGLIFDGAAVLTHRKFAISAVRVKKFCAETCFRSSRISATGFRAPTAIEDGLKRTIQFEFLEDHDGAVYHSE
jgi:GlcNAc-P-P-Und epimerase